MPYGAPVDRREKRSIKSWVKGKIGERIASSETAKEQNSPLDVFTDFVVNAEEISMETGVDVTGKVVEAADKTREWFWPKVEKGGPIALTVATVVFPTSRLRWEAAKRGTIQEGLEKVSKIAADIEPMTGPFAPFIKFGRQFLLAEHRARQRNSRKGAQI